MTISVKATTVKTSKFYLRKWDLMFAKAKKFSLLHPSYLWISLGEKQNINFCSKNAKTATKGRFFQMLYYNWFFKLVHSFHNFFETGENLCATTCRHFLSNFPLKPSFYVSIASETIMEYQNRKMFTYFPRVKHKINESRLSSLFWNS